MRFQLTEDQAALQDAARRFATERLAPDYMAREASGEGSIDPALIREMGELGLIGADLPEEHGGLGVDGVTCGVILEQIAYGDFNVAYIQLMASLMGRILCNNASEEIVAHWVPKITSGTDLVALGLTEPRGGSDAANLTVRAEKSGNGYVLNGEKTSITFSDQMSAIIVFARTGAAEDGAHGVSAFVVPAGEPGLSASRFDDLGTTIISRGSVSFDNVKVPADQMLDDEGKGFVQVMRGFDYSRALIGLQCIAPAQASLDESWEYVTEREAFGGPLARFQGVSFPLAEGETLINAARLLCYETLDKRDRDQPHTKEAAMAKWFAPKTAVDVIHNCLLAHGHSGYTKDLPHQQRLRDVIGLEIGDGTAQVMKMIIAREKVGKVAVQYQT
jgi:cyclohexanecarboxyl-CoA dehydrogenase